MNQLEDEREDVYEMEVVPLKVASVKAESNEPRRDSTLEKVMEHEQREFYLRTARCKGTICVVLFASLLIYAGWAQILESINIALQRARWFTRGKSHDFPSLNLLEYEFRLTFPVFSEKPNGLLRSEMPQLPERNSSFWVTFSENLEHLGGSLSEEEVDLRFTVPLQSELSGFIVYNVLFDRIRAYTDKNPKFFAHHVILVETPVDLVGRFGERIPRGTLLNLDGHHTNEVLKLCAKIQHPNLRRGMIHNDEHICAKGFRTFQKVSVVKGVHPLQTIEAALGAGADSGHGMTVQIPADD